MKNPNEMADRVKRAAEKAVAGLEGIREGILEIAEEALREIKEGLQEMMGEKKAFDEFKRNRTR